MEHLSNEETEYAAVLDSRESEGLPWISLDEYRAMYPRRVAPVVLGLEGDIEY